MNIQARIALSVLTLAFAAGASGIALAQGAQGQGGAAAQSQAPATPDQPPSAAGSGAPPPATSQAGNPILNMKAGEIAGREVYNNQGKELGKVDMIGRTRDTGELSAIIAVGGFLGFGGSKVAIPIEQLSLQQDKLVLSTAMSKKELRNQASDYQSKRYEAVAEDTTLSQAAPGATAAAGGMSGGAAGSSPSQAQTPPGTGRMGFQQLDANSDGYISRDEASKDPMLSNSWRQVDRNNDGRIDSSEFSAFEQGGASGSGELRPSGDNMRERGSRSAPPQQQ